MWAQRYAEGTTGWDLGGPAPALVSLLATIEDKPLRVLIPGCGFAHDAIAWARAGHDALGVDYAEAAVVGARANAERQGVAIEVQQADFFDLPAELDGTFDAVWEQTCYCAIHPSQRDAYVEVCARLLKPGARYYGILWNHAAHSKQPPDRNR